MNICDLFPELLSPAEFNGNL